MWAVLLLCLFLSVRGRDYAFRNIFTSRRKDIIIAILVAGPSVTKINNFNDDDGGGSFCVAMCVL